MRKIKALISSLFVSIFLIFAACTNTYEITDISQYRTIPGTNYYGKYIAKYSNLVMPKKIEDFLSLKNILYYIKNGKEIMKNIWKFGLKMKRNIKNI